MKKMICEICGGKDIIKTNGFFMCNSCGCKYTIEEVKKLIDVENNRTQLDSLYKNDNEGFGSEVNYKVIGIDKNKELDICKYLDNRFQSKNVILSQKLFDSIQFINRELTFVGMAIYRVDGICNYSGTACFNKKVPYNAIDYDYSFLNGKLNKIKKEETKFFDELNKKPFNGMVNFCYNVVKVINSNDKISENTLILESVADKYMKQNFKRELVKEIPETIVDDLINKFIDINTNFDNNIEEKLRYTLRNKKQGDFTEKFSYNFNYDIKEKKLIILPYEKITFEPSKTFYIINSLSKDIDYTSTNFLAEGLESQKEDINGINKLRNDIISCEEGIKINNIEIEKCNDEIETKTKNSFFKFLQNDNIITELKSKVEDYKRQNVLFQSKIAELKKKILATNEKFVANENKNKEFITKLNKIIVNCST